MPAAQPSNKNSFREIATIRDPDGLVAVITERESDGTISFCIFREFERRSDDGIRTDRSTYCRHRHIAGFRRLLQELDRRLEGIEDRTRGERRIAAGAS